MLKLGVNVDHVATLREARKTVFPDPVEAALICEKAGAHGITAHLREDRRHIQDTDIKSLAKKVKRLNMEMAVTREMVEIAYKIEPACCCLVPEKRQEVTTEGGLDVVHNFKSIKDAVQKLSAKKIVVSIFIDPDKEQIKLGHETGAEFIELHTGAYANANGKQQTRELEKLIKASEYANGLGIKVNAGHGIDYENISGILEIPHLVELNIGHSIIARSVFTGIYDAVKEMLDLMSSYDF